MKRNVYLDCQSSTPVLPEVYEAMLPWFKEYYGNASALHELGVRSRKALNQSRERFAAAIGAERSEDIVFTSCGTEANNLAIKGSAYALEDKGRHIVTTVAEHPSVENSIAFLEKHGFRATRVKVDRFGRVNPADVEVAIEKDTVLIATHYANHDIGTIQPVEEIGEIAERRHIQFFVDCNFSAGWLPLNVNRMKAGLVSLSPHRFYGPKGVGVLWKARRSRLISIINGGIQEENRRSGTENVPAIVGGGVAVERASAEFSARTAHVAELQSRLWNGIRSRIDCVCLNGAPLGENRHPCNLNVSAEFIEGEGQLLLCNASGIAVSSGSSCVSRNLKYSSVLSAIGLDETLAQGNLIFSVGKDNTSEEIDYVIESYAGIVERLRGMSPVWDDYRKGVIQSKISQD